MKQFQLISPHKKHLKPGKTVMGILNVTPDSFSDGGKYFRFQNAVKHTKELIRDGADIVDIGGESTRPNGEPVLIEEELRRVIPVIKAISRFPEIKKRVWISIDTYKSEVAKKAIEAGADMINDVTALRGDPEMADMVAQYKVPIVLMYSKDPKPPTTLKKVRYRDVIKTIMDFFDERTRFALTRGIKKSQIILDPGMGAFVSTDPKYSFEILRKLPELLKLGCPILIGSSRKSFLRGFSENTKSPSFFSAWYALEKGASFVRVHEPADLKKIF